jgi:alpha-glucosidase (family GH31 glycosyl hydrolase)
MGIYYPFFRGHAHLETQRREPWLFGEDTTRRIREAIRGRYALLPYIYTLFRFGYQESLRGRSLASIRSSRAIVYCAWIHPFAVLVFDSLGRPREEDTTRRIREAIRGRYALLPYIYTLFRWVMHIAIVLAVTC